jgi:hypothetical protein
VRAPVWPDHGRDARRFDGAMAALVISNIAKRQTVVAKTVVRERSAHESKEVIAHIYPF